MTTARKVAIVTGAARPWGLGRATALMMAQKGYDVAVADIRDDWGAEAVKATKDKGARKAVYVKTDLSKPSSCRAMVDEVVKQFGRVDALCNVAGIVENKRIDDITEAHIDKILGVNLKGVIFTCQAAVQAMRKTGGGTIVNVASGGALQPLKGLSAYSASKAGVIIFSKILAWEVARDNIIVTVVAPGAMLTAMGQEEGPGQDEFERGTRGKPFGRPLNPEEVANVVAYAATIGNPALTGQTLHANGGAYMV